MIVTLLLAVRVVLRGKPLTGRPFPVGPLDFGVSGVTVSCSGRGSPSARPCKAHVGRLNRIVLSGEDFYYLPVEITSNVFYVFI